MLRRVLDEQQQLHEDYGWTTATGQIRRFDISGGTCRVALACIREGWNSIALIDGLRAICWRDAHAMGDDPRTVKRRGGASATLHGMLGGGRELQTEKADKLERALAEYDNAGRPEAAPVVSTSAPSKGGGAFVPRGRYS